MHSIQSLIMSLMLVFSVVGLANCSTANVKKVKYDTSANPADEIHQLEADIADGYTQHYDVLAADNFQESQDYLAKSERQLSKNEAKDAFDSLGYARGYLNAAKDEANSLQGTTKGILDARTSALKAGARDYPKERDTLKDLDDQVRSEVSDLSAGKTSPGKWAELQQGYLTLELRAIQESKLASAKQAITNSIDNGAKKNCPNMLAQAIKDYDAAKNIIAANRHDDQAINPAIETSDQSAQLLKDVLAATKTPGGTVNEDAAKEIVMKNRQNASLGKQLNNASSEAAAEGQQLVHQNQELKAQDATVRLDKALEDARKQFTHKEADVYRKGQKLLLRLKSVDFAVGRSDLPKHSLPVLAKVKTVMEELNPSQIVIEGHTDSTGKDKTNKVLSQDRADAVAAYFASNGFEKDKIETIGRGYEKPVSSNKSKPGRAQNRGVDVTLTPAAAQTGSADSTTL